MPNYEDELRERTHKGEFFGDDEEVERRVYYTLAGDKASDGVKPAFPQLSNDDLHLHLHRMRRLLAFLTAKGVLSGAISAEELDTALFSLTR